jgi:hypothetical protein
MFKSQVWNLLGNKNLERTKIHCPFLFLFISHNIFVSFDNMDKAKEPKEENYVINR